MGGAEAPNDLHPARLLAIVYGVLWTDASLLRVRAEEIDAAVLVALFTALVMGMLLWRWWLAGRLST